MMMGQREDRAGEWLDTDLPALRAADLVRQACADRDPYFNDRPWQRVADWAEGRNHFARPFPDAPWIDRAHGTHRNDFPIPEVASCVRQRRFESLIGVRPEKVA